MDRLKNLPTAIFTGEVLCNLNLTEVSELRAVNRTMKETISLNREYILKVCFHVLPHGLVQVFNEDGRILDISAFKEGKLHGIQRVFYSNKHLLAVNHYEDDKKHGLHKKYYLNGATMMETYYNQNDAHGRHVCYYENGQITQVGNYCRNQKVGEWMSYFANGQLQRKEFMREPDCP
jgi:hypothetical protein